MDLEILIRFQQFLSAALMPILILVVLWLVVTWQGQCKRSKEQHKLYISHLQQSEKQSHRVEEVNDRTVVMLERWAESINRLNDIMDKIDSKLEK